jgi:hypothetical protein
VDTAMNILTAKKEKKRHGIAALSWKKPLLSVSSAVAGTVPAA